MRCFIIFVLFLWAAPALAQDQRITTFILVRHAEKESNEKDPELSQIGMDRAKRLAELLKDSNISAVYSTRYKRTQQTVTPIAQLKNLAIRDYESLSNDDLRNLTSEHFGRTILIAGHSNTIPKIANALIGKEQFQNLHDAEFGIVFIISVLTPGKEASILTLHY
ncbi:MAG TPA: phosphoglycerate mutase family protein [Chryseosolibacter sp.]